MTEESIQDKLIFLLQKGLPLESRPFSQIAGELNWSEDTVLAEIKKLQQEGMIRRFGGVFNSASLGFKSCLCAVNIPDDEVDRINAMISPDPGVTHFYIRDGEPNLWFTYTAHKSNYDDGLQRFKRQLKPYKMLVMPSKKRFKIQVIFDKSGSEKTAPPPPQEVEEIKLSKKEKQVISYLQGNIPISINLYKDIAKKVDYSENELLGLLVKWQEKGALKRISAIIRHQRFGFKGNAMCVWKVPADQVDELGAKLADRPEVSHCYKREMLPEFPYNLYAMIHAESLEEVKEKFCEIEKNEDLKNGKMLLTKQELKKSSPVYYKYKMKLSVYIMSVIIFLLVAGAFPLLGAEAVYRGGLMISLMGILSILSLICCFKQKFHIKKLGFYLSHLGVVVLLAGALTSFIWGKKVNFGTYIGKQYFNDKIYNLQTQQPVPVDLGFSFSVSEFKVEKFDPVFSVYKMPDQKNTSPEKIKDYSLINGKIILDDELGTFSVAELKDPNGEWKPHILLKDKFVLFTNKPGDKWYSANLNIRDGKFEKAFPLAVNHPVSYKKWRFYLMNYGRDQRGQYLLMTGRNDPGRIVVISGIWILILGIFMICLLRKNKEISDA